MTSALVIVLGKLVLLYKMTSSTVSFMMIIKLIVTVCPYLQQALRDQIVFVTPIQHITRGDKILEHHRSSRPLST